MSAVADIRNSTATLLSLANVANGKVFNSKVIPTMLKNTPAVIVFAGQIKALNSSPMPVFSSSVNLQINVVVSLTDTWADDADNLVELIINTLMSNTTWVDQFTLIDGYQVDYSFTPDAERPVATAEITIVGKVFKAF